MNYTTVKKNFLKASIWAILGILVFGLLNFISISSIGFNPKIPLDSSVPVSAQNEDKPYIFIVKGGRYSYQNGGLISYSSKEQSLIQVQSYKAYGSAKVQIFEASQADLFDFLSHDSKNYQTKKISSDGMNLKDQLNYNIVENQEANDLALPLAENGIYLVKAILGDVSTQVMVVRSSFGVVLSQNSSQFIFWAQDYTTGKRISGNNITTYNFLNGPNELDSSSFDDEGVAKTKAVAEADVAIAEVDGNLAVVPINLTYLNYEWNYKSFVPKAKATEYFMFTDRPLYKPGDKLHFKAILRYDQDVQFSIPKGKVRVSLQGGANNATILKNKEFTISDSGAIDGDIDIPADVATGDYSLILSPINSKSDDDFYGGGETYFQIQYYTKPEYTIDLSLDKSEIIVGQPVKATINASYFSGSPVINQKISYQVLANDFSQYEVLTDNYNFSDYQYGGYGNTTIDSGEATLDNSGKAEVTLNTSKYGDTNGNLLKGVDKILSIQTQLKDQSQNPVMASKNMVSFAGDYDIFRKNYDSYNGQTNQKYNLPLVLATHNIAEKKQSNAGRDLTAKIKRTWWEKVENPDKKYPDWNQKEENLPDVSFKSNDKGEATMTFIPINSGSYTFSIESNDNSGRLVTNSFSTWINDTKQPVWDNSSNETRISIKSDKPSYKPGEKAKMTVSADKANVDVFISTERENLSRYKVITLKGKSVDFDLSIVDTDLPNVFVSAFTFLDDGLNKSQSELKVSAESRKLNVTLTPNQTKYGPGDTVTLNVETKDSGGKPIAAETTVWSVDKAIYELSDSKLQNIFDRFYHERYNQSGQSDSLQGIAAAQGGAEGGGCFTGDTNVLMADGSSKEISKIQAGDMVLTRSDENKPNLVSARVNQVMEHEVDGYLIINGSLKVTPEHRIYIRHANTLNNYNNSNGSKSHWITAGFAQIGDILMDSDGKDLKINSIEWQAGLNKVYNLEIDIYHTYFAGGVFVHNDKGGGSRSTFSDTAYWNPSVQTDKNGKATLTFKLPDNLTTWVLAGISATNDSKFGQTETEIIVSKPIIVRPIVPNILRVGDENTVSAIVQNGSGREQKLGTDFVFPNGEITQNNTDKTFTLKNGETKQIFWKVKPNKADDKAKITFAAYKTDDVNIGDRIEYEVPVIAYGFSTKSAQTGDKAKNFDLSLFPDSDLNRSKITLQLSPTLLGALPSSMDYLIGYPYGCVEQTTSRFVPSIIAYENPDIFKNAFKDYDKDDLLNKGVLRLAELQQDDGGWGFWTNGASNPYISAYVTEYLNRAFVLKPDLKAKFDAKSKRDPSSYFEVNLANYTDKDKLSKDYISAIYALSMVNKVDLTQDSQNKINSFITDYNKYFKDQNSDMLALIVMANYRNGVTDSKENGLDILMSKSKIEGQTLFWPSGDETDFGSNNTSTALALKAMMETKVDKDFQAKAVRFLSNERKSNYWSNTYGTARTIDVLTSYTKQNSELNPNYSYTVSLDGQEIDGGQVTKNTDIKDIVIDLNKIKSTGSKLSIAQTGQGAIYSTLLNNQFRTDPKFNGLNQGLNVTRQYVNSRGETEGLIIGDIVNVKITVSGLNTNHNYGMVADELPSGLVPINTAFDNEQFNQTNTANDYYNYISDREVTRNGINMHVYTMKTDTITYTYQARVVSAGSFNVPPARAELMYYPEINGLSKAETLITSTSPFTIASQITTGNPSSTPSLIQDFQVLPETIKDLSQVQKRLFIILGSVAAGVIILAGAAIYILKKEGKIFKGKPKEEELDLPQINETAKVEIDSEIKEK